MHEELLGPTSPKTAVSLTGVAKLRRQQGDPGHSDRLA